MLLRLLRWTQVAYAIAHGGRARRVGTVLAALLRGHFIDDGLRPPADRAVRSNLSRGLFYDVGEFHRKFGLTSVNEHGPNAEAIDPNLREFRFKFLEEELAELRAGYAANDLTQVADALADLVYVALGTAHLHRIPFDEVWHEVQRANMTKERCLLDHAFKPCSQVIDTFQVCPYGEDVCHETVRDVPGKMCGQPATKHSKRGSANDVIKPTGWVPPRIAEVLCVYRARAENHVLDVDGNEVCACGLADYRAGAHAHPESIRGDYR